MRYTTLLPTVCLLIFIAGCKKEKESIPEVVPPVVKPEPQSFYKDLKIDSVTQLSLVVSFQLTGDNKGLVGVATELDSSRLIKVEDYMLRQVSYQNGRYTGKIEWPLHLPPENDLIWFRIFITDEKGVKQFSPIFKQRLATYEISQRYIVNGKGAYNKHPKDFFINWDGRSVGTFDNSLIVKAVTKDTDVQNYRATLAELPIGIGSIVPNIYSESHKQIVFDVPDDFPLGVAVFKLYYLNKLVYTAELTIVNGGLLTKDDHLLPEQGSHSIFVHNDELYTLNAASDFGFYKWNPNTKVWKSVPGPASQPNIGYVRQAHSVGGTIYFPPTDIRSRSPDAQNPFFYKEIITTFNPDKGAWKESELFFTGKTELARGLWVLASFVIKDDIYYVVRQFNENLGAGGVVLKVLKTKSMSWETVMDLSYAFYKAVVINDQPYILRTSEVIGEWGSLNFTSEFYLLDLPSKTLVKKDWVIHKNASVNYSYLAAFKGRIYLYGGYNSTGYNSLYSSMFAVYDPMKDQWAPVSGYSYFTGWVSQTDGFMMPIGDKLYVGLGRDRYSNGNIYAGKVNASISQLSVR